ncbi:histone-like nucleoid-structuring protein Lsr2 [Rarobacter incanus]|uniref:Lsr2 protein n=1 Tax=Rarobacter incanus TaxID=153494 RepID=A0A542SNY7_9MICO|nr:Lsr2 family protein [Rarobacter incanus]TQK76351.1 Lsr2 protein [Rarobacter incanus]
MAQRVQVVLEDDIDGGPATGSVSFALDGTAYEIDLNDENAARLRDSIAVWIRHARRVGRVNKGQAVKRAGRVEGRNNTSDMRTWLIDNGYQVSARGRISAEMQQAYLDAH